MNSKVEFFEAVRNLEKLYRAEGFSREQFVRRYFLSAIGGEFPLKEDFIDAVQQIHSAGTQWYLRELCQDHFRELQESRLLSVWSQAQTSGNWLAKNWKGDNERANELRAEARAIAEEEHRRQKEELHWDDNVAKVREILTNDLETADKRISEIEHLDYRKYIMEKCRFIKHLLSTLPLPHELSNEQLEAIGNCDKTVLLRARAGSGKTTVIKQKVNFHIRFLRYAPSEIMVLAFNRDAAEQVKRGLRKEFNQLDFDTSYTFHSLAHRIVKPTQQLLYDAGTGSNAKQSQLVERLLAEESNPSFRRDLFQFFRHEMKEMENIGSLLTKEDYYTFKRASAQETLGGEFVKSTGEKWLADFLFEHGIRYVYERPWYRRSGGEGNYYPDFSLAVRGSIPDVVIEHWGIDELSPNETVPEHWTISWSDYKDQMVAKREYWANWNRENPTKPVKFLETSIRDMSAGRASFEAVLIERLNGIGVACEKLPEEQLIENVVRRKISKFSRMCLQYIQRAKQKKITSSDIYARAKRTSFSCPREEIFVDIASRIFLRYEQFLHSNGFIDFSDLMSLSTDRVNSEKGKLVIDNGSNSTCDLQNVKLLLIDEYQDFSPLFFNLVTALRRYNDNLKIFCVGDDWQAINGFAGSDLKYFNDFESHFDSPTLLDLRNNYRSQGMIVDQSNRFMRASIDESSVPKSNLPARSLKLLYSNDVFIERRQHIQLEENSDSRFMTYVQSRGELRNCDVGDRLARQLKACYQVMLQYHLDSTQFMILNRGNYMGYKYESLVKFKSKLKSCFQPQELAQFRNFDSQVQCLTAHRSKGREADVVILLNALQRRFPILHPDNQLFGILDVNTADVYKEEERLFYVAITRAKQSLYIVSERGQESEFLDRIHLSKVDLTSYVNQGSDTF